MKWLTKINWVSVEYVGLLIGTTLLGILCLMPWLFTYETLINYALSLLQRNDLRAIIETTYFTQEKFILLKKISLISATILFTVAIFLSKKKKNVIIIFRAINQVFYQYFQLTVKFQKQMSNTYRFVWICILCFTVLRSMYYALTIDMQYDEVWNYNYFLSKNILFSIFSYNNYPLHNIVTNAWLWFVPDTPLMIRMPVIIMGVISCLIVFNLITHITQSSNAAVISTGIYTTLPIIVNYMLRARGVIFEISIILLSVHVILIWLQHPTRKKYMYILVCLQGLGTLAMLSHLYFIVFSSIGIALYLYTQPISVAFKWSFIYLTGSILCSVLFLLPMWAGTGISLGIEAAQSGAKLLALHEKYSWMCYSRYTSFSSYGIVFCLFVLGFVAIKHKPYISLFLFLIVISTSVLFIPILSNTAPPERTMGMLVLLPVCTIGLLIHHIRQWNISPFWVLPLILGLSAYQAQQAYFNWSLGLDKQVKTIYQCLVKNKIHHIQIQTSYADYFIPGLLYYSQFHQYHLTISSLNKQSTRYVAQDTLAQAFIVAGANKYPIDKNIFTSKHFKVVFK